MSDMSDAPTERNRKSNTSPFAIKTKQCLLWGYSHRVLPLFLVQALITVLNIEEA